MPGPNQLWFQGMMDNQISPELEKIKNNAKNTGTQMRQAGDEASYSMRNARGFLQLLARDFGITLPRAVQTFLADTKAIGPILAAAFSGAAIATIAVPIFGQVINKIESIAEAAEKTRRGWADFSLKMVEDTNKMADSFEQLSVKTTELSQGKLAALRREFELLGKVTKSVDASTQQLFDDFAKLADGAITLQDRIVGVIGYLLGFNRAAFAGQGGTNPLKTFETGFKDAGKEAAEFGEKLRRITAYQGVQAGLLAVNEELTKVYKQLQETPDAKGWIEYAETIEFKQHELQIQLDTQAERRKQKEMEITKTTNDEANKRAKVLADEIAKRDKLFTDSMKRADTELSALGERWGKVSLGELEKLDRQYEADSRRIMNLVWAPFGPENAKKAGELWLAITEAYLEERRQLLDKDLQEFQTKMEKMPINLGPNPISELYGKYPVRALPPPEYPIPDFSSLDRKLSIVRTSVYGVNEAFTDMFRGIGQGTMSAAEMFQNLAAAAIDAMGRMITQMFIVNVLMRAMSGLFGLGAGTKIGGAGTTVPTTTPPALYGATWPGAPGHDYPGPAMAGRTYRIGTAEYFTPATDGWIQPVRGAGSQAVTVNVVNQSSQPLRGKASQQIDAKGLVTTIVLTDFDTNGPIAQALKAGR